MPASIEFRAPSWAVPTVADVGSRRMGFFNTEPPLQPSEQIRWFRPMGYSLKANAIAGRLYVTTSELIFVPSNLARRHKNDGPPRTPLTDIADIGVQERTGTPYNGGMRRRLRVELRDGRVHLFMVNNAEQIASELNKLLQA